MQFDKMHGLGNDFIFINKQEVSENSAVFWRKICDRHEGIGADLVVVYDDSSLSQLKTRFFNCDGSEAEICGNAARCLGKLIKIRTGSISCNIFSAEKNYPVVVYDNDMVRVDMGVPDFSAQAIGIQEQHLDNLYNNLPLRSIEPIAITALSVGNPHLVIVLKELPNESIIQTVGSQLEKHSMFAHHINISFAQLVNNSTINLRVFERGVGLTRACASGATAAAYGIWDLGLLSVSDICVKQIGGNLQISIGSDQSVSQTGPAHYVFSGVFING